MCRHHSRKGEEPAGDARGDGLGCLSIGLPTASNIRALARHGSALNLANAPATGVARLALLSPC
jgi:hypothetical protein